MPVFTAAAGAVVAATGAFAAGSTGFLIAQSVVAAGLAAGVGNALGIFDGPDLPTSAVPEFTDPGVDQRLGANTTNKLPCLYGQWVQRGALVYGEVEDDRQTLYAVIALGEGPATSIDRIYWDDLVLTLDSDGEVTNAVGPEGATDRLNGNLNVQTYLGTATNNNSTYLQTRSTNWTANHRMTNIVYAVVTVRYNRDDDITGLSDMRFIGTSPITSPADAVMDQLTNPRYGLGLASSQIDSSSFTAANTYFNANVSHTASDGSTVMAPRFRVNGTLGTDVSVIDRIEDILEGSNSSLRWSDGRYGIFVNRADTVQAFDFNLTNTIGDINVTEVGLNSLVNRLEIQYGRDEANNWQANTLIIETPQANRFPNEPDRSRLISLPLVATSVEAERVGTIILNQAREQLVIRHRADITAMPLEAGDVITYTMPNYGWNAKQFRVVKVSEIEEEGRIEYEIEAIEYTASIYTDRTFIEPGAAPNTNLPSADEIPAVTDLSIISAVSTSATPTVTVGWTVPTGGLYEVFDIYVNGAQTGFNTPSTVFSGSLRPVDASFTSGTSHTFDITGLIAGNYNIWVVGRNAFASSDESNTVALNNWNPVVAVGDTRRVIRENDNPVTMDPGAPTGFSGTGGGWYDPTSTSRPADPDPHWLAEATVPVTNTRDRVIDFALSGTTGEIISTSVDVAQNLLFTFQGDIGESTQTTVTATEQTQFTLSGQAASGQMETFTSTQVSLQRTSGGIRFADGVVDPDDPIVATITFSPELNLAPFSVTSGAATTLLELRDNWVAQLNAVEGISVESTSPDFANFELTQTLAGGVLTDPFLTITRTSGNLTNGFFNEAQSVRRGVDGFATATTYSITYAGSMVASGGFLADSDSDSMASQLQRVINDLPTHRASAPVGSVFTATSRMNSGDDLIVTITAGVNSPTGTSTNNAAISRVVTRQGAAGSEFIGSATIIDVFIGETSIGRRTFNGGTLDSAITAIAGVFTDDGRYTATTDLTANTIRVMSTFTGVTPTATIQVIQAGTSTSGVATGFAIGRNVTSDGVETTIASGQLSSAVVTIGSDVGTIEFGSGDTAAEAARLLETYLISRTALYGFSVTNSTIRATSSGPDSIATDITIVLTQPGLTSTNTATNFTISRTLIDSGSAGSADLTNADWVYYPTSREVRVDDDTTMMETNGSIAVRRGLIEDVLALDFASNATTPDIATTTTTLTTSDSNTNLIISGTVVDFPTLGATTTTAGNRNVAYDVELSADGNTWFAVANTPFFAIDGASAIDNLQGNTYPVNLGIGDVATNTASSTIYQIRCRRRVFTGISAGSVPQATTSPYFNNTFGINLLIIEELVT